MGWMDLLYELNPFDKQNQNARKKKKFEGKRRPMRIDYSQAKAKSHRKLPKNKHRFL